MSTNIITRKAKLMEIIFNLVNTAMPDYLPKLGDTRYQYTIQKIGKEKRENIGKSELKPTSMLL